MPHYHNHVEAQVGDVVLDKSTESQGTVVALNGKDCRVTVDFGKYRMTAPTIWFEKVA